ncbi:MAG: alpha/beta hydrolase family protein, partial [Planctomycetota bacterium]
DGAADWAFVEPSESKTWMICLHGHGSHGDQLYTRQDIVDVRLKNVRDFGYSIVSPNLRDNAWMCPEAVYDLHNIIAFIKAEYSAEKIVLFSGSMGGTSALIYALQHREDLNAVIAGCPATDLARFYKWCRKQQKPPVLKEIADAIENAYGGDPEEKGEVFQKHSTAENYKKLTMPVYLSHGNDDQIIPVNESRDLAEKLSAVNPDFIYNEIEGGNHDAPLKIDREALEWVQGYL